MVRQEWKSEIKSDELLAEVKRLNYFTDDTGTRMARRQSDVYHVKQTFPVIVATLDEIARYLGKRVRNYMVNILPAYCNGVPLHTDTLQLNVDAGEIILERWHLPIVTNPHAYYWEESLGNRADGSMIGLNMLVGYWYGPIAYHTKHTIWNAGAEDRYNLVVDLE